ncbi:RagB/SusD family nutrient uptake outer membrane protein [Mucilaginibacter sp. UYCu711]|uniref:RagB/SusD family nutrient uptake outer membrane protein n=1 Tax=Mucilaginibacter sp. UYCu711 TaxID=3156339 RepID=UPI003D263D8E
MKNLKYISISSIILLFVSIMGTSCKKSLDSSLDITPHDRLTSNTVFATVSTADLVLNDIYNQLPDGNNWDDPFDNWSDNSICGYSSRNSRTEAQQNNYTPATLGFGNNSDALNLGWQFLYTNIRKCNVFIANVTASTLADDYKKKRIAETRFLRAYFYHLLWMAYGGLPILTNPLDVNTQGDAAFVERSSSDDTYKFIATELTAITPDMPTTSDPGRATQGATLALLGWVQLYHHDFAAAATTTKQIIDGKLYDLYPDYQNLFLDNTVNKEAIFYRQYIAVVKGNRFAGIGGPTFTKNGVETSWGSTDPTQELVDDYAMDNGLPIAATGSGYDAKHPYLHREKRFYQSIVYDGSYFYNDTIYTRQGIKSPNEIDLSDKNDATQTGYYLRKKVQENIPLGSANWDGRTGAQNYYYFRYGEVLLMYAEAQNEGVGPDNTVYDAINKVRARSALPNLTPGLSQDVMRTAIRRERRIELAFEDKRLWDLRRWKLAEINLNKPVHGIAITANGSGGFNYNPVTTPGGNLMFDASKNYLFPLPQRAVDQNAKLKQNPGY